MIKETDNYIYFTRDSIYGNYWPTTITSLDLPTFKSSEHSYQWRKARFWNASEIMAAILETPEPQEARECGRRLIPDFKAAKWNEAKRQAMFDSVLPKFRDNRELREMILGTGSKCFVCLGHSDWIWSCGLDFGDPGLQDYRRWPGRNMLGSILTDVRETLRMGLFLSAGLWQ